MKRILLVFSPATAAMLALAFGGLASAKPPAPLKKTVVCHQSSGKKAYHRLVLGTRAAIHAHMAHDGDIVHAGASVSQAPACPSQPLTASGGGGVRVSTTLAPSAPNTIGGGTFVLRANFGQGKLCFTLAVTGLGDVTMAHIHTFPVAPNNIVVPLPLAGRFNAAGTTSECMSAPRALVKSILRNPSGYYVSVHTRAFPDSAVQGALSR